MPRVSNTFEDYTSIKPLNKFFIMLERNSVNVHSNTPHSSHCKSEHPACRRGDFGHFFDGLAKSPSVLRSS